MKTIKHIHATNSLLNPTFYFVLDDRLLSFDVCTPLFNDYGEYRLHFSNFSPLPYNPNDNSVELAPLDIPDISVDDEVIKYFDLIQKRVSDIPLTESEEQYLSYKEDEYEFNSLEVCGGFENDALVLSINNHTNIKHADWLLKDNHIIDDMLVSIYFYVSNALRNKIYKQ